MPLAILPGRGMYFGQQGDTRLLLGYFVLMVALLAFAWRQFDRSSVAAGTLFARTPVAMPVTSPRW